MSSAAGKVPSPGQAVYSASKFALNGYFHSLRSEVKNLLLASTYKYSMTTVLLNIIFGFNLFQQR